jgi:hypothetical protein
MAATICGQGQIVKILDMRKLNYVVFFTIGGTVFVALLLTFLFLYPALDVGNPMREVAEGPHKLAEYREDFKTVLDSYNSAIKLITAAFAVIAFIVTYHQKQGGRLSNRAWGLLVAGIILLGGALLFCLFGQELMLKMLAANLTDLEYAPLTATRWFAYGCFLVAAILIGFFAVEVAGSSPGSISPEKEVD